MGVVTHYFNNHLTTINTKITCLIEIRFVGTKSECMVSTGSILRRYLVHKRQNCAHNESDDPHPQRVANHGRVVRVKDGQPHFLDG